MNQIFKIFYSVLFLFSLFSTLSINANALEDNPYISKIHPVSDKDDAIYFDTKNIDGNANTLLIESKGFSDSEDLYWIPSNSKKNSFDLAKPFKSGAIIKVYLTYYKKDADEISKILLDTITVIDKTAPKIKVSDLTVRNTSFNIITDKDATISATYNNKKIKVIKSTSTKWKAIIPKPLKGKKLVITSKDAAGNSKKITKTTKLPSITFFAYSSQAVEKKITGSVYDAKSTDKVHLKIGSKTYKGSIKGTSFKVAFGKVTTPKKVTLYLKDKFGNTLAKDTTRIYKYSDAIIGMTKSQVLNSIYGSPDAKSSDRYGKDFYEYWRYDYIDEMIFLNFYNGKLNSISSYEN